MTFEEVLEKTKNVKALLAPGDKEGLYKYASEVPDGGIIVDIGTAMGGSAFIMALASKPNCRVFTIDPVQNDSFLFWRKELNLEEKVYYFNETSEDAIKHLQNTDIDFIFEDGVHGYHGVRIDWELYGARLKIGSMIAFHDYYLYDGIQNYIKEILDKGEIEKVELIEDKYQDEVLTGLFVGIKL